MMGLQRSSAWVQRERFNAKNTCRTVNTVVLQSLSPLLVPDWVIFGCWRKRIRQICDQQTSAWKTEHVQFYATDLDMNELHNHRWSPEAWLRVPAVQWRTLVWLLKYIDVFADLQIFGSYFRLSRRPSDLLLLRRNVSMDPDPEVQG